MIPMTAAIAITRSTRLMSPRVDRADNQAVFTNYGEWAGSNLLFGLVFLAAAIGVAGIGYWVVRADRLNRIDELTTDTGDDNQPSEAH